MLTHPRSGAGYGYFGFQGITCVAHRVVYALTHPGEITFEAPKNKHLKQFVLHKCDNRICCNPKHLFLGNYDDNNKDAMQKGRANAARGECHPKSKLSNKTAQAVRVLLAYGHSIRELQTKLGVTENVIRRIKAGRGYRA